MKKLQIFTILLALFALNINYAQEDLTEIPFILTDIANGVSTDSPSTLYSFDNSDKSVHGSAYIQEIFMPAKLSLMDGTKIFKLKYNAYNDEIEIENESGKANALNKNIDNLLIVFVSDDKTYQALDYVDKDANTTRGYFVHVNSAISKYKLLIKETVIFIDRKPAKTSYDKTKPAELKRIDDKYFIAIGTDAAVEFPKKKKEFPKVFPDKHKDILSFMKKNKIKTSKDKDLVELINYINTL